MRRFLALALATVLLLATVATAGATTTATLHFHAGEVGDIGAVGCTPGDFIVTVGNAVEHQTTNNAGDSWFTATVTGTFVTSDQSGYTGHVTAWFGVEQNARNVVNHGTVDAQGTLADGTILRVHGEGQFTVNAQGIPVVNMTNLSCN